LCNDDGKVAGMYMYTGLTRQRNVYTVKVLRAETLLVFYKTTLFRLDSDRNYIAKG